MKRLRPSPLHFQGLEGVSAAQPTDESVLKAKNEFEMVIAHGRSVKLEDLNVED